MTVNELIACLQAMLRDVPESGNMLVYHDGCQEEVLAVNGMRIFDGEVYLSELEL